MVGLPVRWVAELRGDKQLHARLLRSVRELRLSTEAWSPNRRDYDLSARQRLLEGCGIVVLDLDERCAELDEFRIFASTLKRKREVRIFSNYAKWKIKKRNLQYASRH